MSVNGGRWKLTGLGLPNGWPNSAYSYKFTKSSKTVPMNVISSTTTEMIVSVPEGVAGDQFTLELSVTLDGTVHSASRSVTLQNPGNTATLALSSSQIDPNTVSTITLTKGAGLSSDTAVSVHAYLKWKPMEMISIDMGTVTEASGQITFDKDFEVGLYVFSALF